MSAIGVSHIDFANQPPADHPPSSSSAYTDRVMEPVGALEHNFEAKERAASFARATVKNVPLLLKPNGVPVF